MATKQPKTLLGDINDVLDKVLNPVFPEFDPDFPKRAAKALAEQAAKEALQALADSNSMPVAALALVTAARVFSIQGGQVINNNDNDLQITFNQPVQNPTFIITNLFNEDNHSSDIGYTNLTSNGVVVKRGYSMTAGGLQDFSWVVLSVTNPTVGGGNN